MKRQLAGSIVVVNVDGRREDLLRGGDRGVDVGCRPQVDLGGAVVTPVRDGHRIVFVQVLEGGREKVHSSAKEARAFPVVFLHAALQEKPEGDGPSPKLPSAIKGRDGNWTIVVEDLKVVALQGLVGKTSFGIERDHRNQDKIG